MHIKCHFLSPNFDQRPNDNIDMIILHYTEMEFNEAYNRLCDPTYKVSAHYLIAKDGIVYRLVDDKMRAWHAGKSYWQGKESLNDCSIGIEIDNMGDEPFTNTQMESCVALCQTLMRQYNIPPNRVLGHSDIAPDRKIDPGVYFNWLYLAKNNIGHQYQYIESNPDTEFHCHEVQQKLKQLGYKIEVTGLWDLQTQHVIRAFQAHFSQNSILTNGHNFYRNMDSKYTWDHNSNSILNFLVNA